MPVQPALVTTLLLAVLLASPATPTHAQSTVPIRVWVNTRSGIYHCPSSDQYGRTANGEYLDESAARTRGFRPRGGRPCASGTAGGQDAALAPVADTASDTTAARLARVLATRPADESPPPKATSRPCTVVRITDGDTIDCRGGPTVRLIGLDAPELNQGPFGLAATAGLAALIPREAVVQLESDVEATDRYGRTLAYIWYRGLLVNWQLIRQGWAVSYPYGRTQRYTAALDAAEARARAEARGLWSLDAFGCRPADWRHDRC